jgi:signal transduction histidine kinase
VLADPFALESIFGNLITNALNYTPEGGAIRVQVRPQRAGIEVAVIDNGLGIEQKDLARIFDRFYRVRNEKTLNIAGTGLGLPIVKGLLDALGGSIAARSTPGQGSVFTVLLPVHA